MTVICIFLNIEIFIGVIDYIDWSLNHMFTKVSFGAQNQAEHVSPLPLCGVDRPAPPHTPPYPHQETYSTLK